MDDFRSQLSATIDDMLAQGVQPVFMVIDLTGMEVIKKSHGQESLDKFRQAVIGAITSAANGCDAFTYGEDRAVAILAGFDRLKTFALADKLRRSLPYLAQSFDCILQPEFDIFEYDAAIGVAGLIAQLVKRPPRRDDVA
jgi:GGDEF domain-containing protein